MMPVDAFLGMIYSVFVFIVILLLLLAASESKRGSRPYPGGALPSVSERDCVLKRLLRLEKVFYFSLIFLGFSISFVGLIIMNSSDNLGIVVFGATEIFAGILVALFHFRMYEKRLKKLYTLEI